MVGIADELDSLNKNAVIKVCGIGGGGGNAVGRMIADGLTSVDFIAINTDAQALRDSPAPTRLQIGSSGLGAGAKPEVGEKAADKDRQRIEEVLTGADMIFLTAGLGGGTGSGAAPVIAEIAKNTGALTVAVVTLPFTVEGEIRMENARRGLEALDKHVDATIVVPNDRLTLLCQDNTPLLNAFNMADEVLHNGVRAISELITVPGLINIDFADVETIMRGSGRALMGIATAEGENRALRAAEEAVVCPLLEQSSIDGATGVIVNVRGGRNLAFKEVHDAVALVKQNAHRRANVIFGAMVDDADRPDVQVTVIGAGFEAREHMQPQPLEQIMRAAVPDDVPPPKPAAPRAPAPPIELHDATPVAPAAAEEPLELFPKEEPRRRPEPPQAAPAPEPKTDVNIPSWMRRNRKHS